MSEPADISIAEHQFDAGDTLLREGGVTEVMYVIQKGKVRLTKQVDGQTTLMGEAGAGDMVGAVGLVRGHPHATTATAVETTRCLVIDCEMVERMVVGDGEIAVRFIRALANEVAVTHELLSMLGRRDTRTRVCLAIARHAELSRENTGAGSLVRKRLGDIAEEVAITDAEMGEISKQLLQKQLLRVKRDGILVPDVSRLYEFVKQHDA